MIPLPSMVQVKQFVLEIPKKDHRVFHKSYHEVVSGSDILNYLKVTYKLNDDDAVEWGNYLLRGNIIEAQNNRFNPSFAARSGYIYKLTVCIFIYFLFLFFYFFFFCLFVCY